MVNQKAMSKVLTDLKYKFMQPRLDRPIMLLKSLVATTSAHSSALQCLLKLGAIVYCASYRLYTGVVAAAFVLKCTSSQPTRGPHLEIHVRHH